MTVEVMKCVETKDVGVKKKQKSKSVHEGRIFPKGIR